MLARAAARAAVSRCCTRLAGPLRARGLLLLCHSPAVAVAAGDTAGQRTEGPVIEAACTRLEGPWELAGGFAGRGVVRTPGPGLTS